MTHVTGRTAVGAAATIALGAMTLLGSAAGGAARRRSPGTTAPATTPGP